ncbi:MAG: phosphatidylinositol-3-phosphate phosphatase [Propionibacteriaceae bacterium]|nr:phosphatidylinositol-3-phosphate phosphatase [Propionibacteriaceae bacterium]
MVSNHRGRRAARRRRRLVVVVGFMLIALVGSGALVYKLVSDDNATTPSTTRPSHGSTQTPTPTATPTPTPTPKEPSTQVDKAIVIVLENHSSAQIRTEAPRLTALADKYGSAPNALAPCGHPSLPNYVCLSAGGRYITSDGVKTLSQPDIWNNTLAAGRTMKMYVDGLPSSVGDRRKKIGKYVPRHVFTVPFVATPTKQANFERYTVNASTLAADVASGDLPNVGGLIPDQCHNAHDDCKGTAPTQVKQADDWIADQVQVLQSGPDWKSGHLMIVVTADEDDKKGVNDIPMIVIHPALSHYSTNAPVDLFSLGGFLADIGHTARLGKQATAPDFAKTFHLTVAAH